MQDGAVGHRNSRLEGTGCDSWCHRVGGVVKAVGEVKDEGSPDDEYEDECVVHGSVLTAGDGCENCKTALLVEISRRFHL